MLPHLRPGADLMRLPDGVERKGASSRSAAPAPPRPGCRPSRARRRHADIQYCVIDEPAGLVWAANMAALELHAPMALAEDLDPPR